MKKVALDIDKQRFDGHVAYSGGTLWIHFAGETYTVESEGRSTRARSRAGSRAHPGEIAAPMPGKIVKIFVKPGETVEEGHVLLVMEAMKMEYTLKAQAKGKVATISAKAGDQVGLGQILVQLETE